MIDLEKILQEKEDEVCQLTQQISSQEESLAQRGTNLPDKASLLSSLTSLTEQLYEAQDKYEQQSLNLTLSKKEADYHQKEAEELKFMVCAH